MSRRPDYIVCVKADVGELHKMYGLTWCGHPVIGFVFQNIDHAAFNGLAEGRLVACRECCDVIIRALNNGHSEGGEA